ncbi:MAG: Fic family protein [Opitutales bacterium]
MQPFKPDRLPLDCIDWGACIPSIGSANRALALYDGVLYGVPNPAVLLSPLTTQEAVLSSKIEGTQATLGEVLQFDAGDEPDEPSKREDINEIINYRRSLRVAERKLQDRPFNLNLLKELHAILLDSVRGRDKARGRFRSSQNLIGAPGDTLETAKFVPPAPEDVMPALDNWERYYHADEIDPLVQLAVLHAQFEIIHPFLDGNGRIGRILVPLYLFEKKLLSSPMFYLSAYLEQHRDEYVERLRVLGRAPDGWTKWVVFFLTGLEEQARKNARTAREVIDLYGSLKLRAIEATHSQFAVPLLDKVFEQPVFTSSRLKWEGEDAPSRGMLANLLRKLTDEGMLKVLRPGSGRRPSTLALAELINLCEGKKVF